MQARPNAESFSHTYQAITAHVLSRVHIDMDHLHIPALMVVPSTAFLCSFGWKNFYKICLGLQSQISQAWGDQAVNSQEAPSMVYFHLTKSKCDPFARGWILFWVAQVEIFVW